MHKLGFWPMHLSRMSAAGRSATSIPSSPSCHFSGVQISAFSAVLPFRSGQLSLSADLARHTQITHHRSAPDPVKRLISICEPPIRLPVHSLWLVWNGLV